MSLSSPRFLIAIAIILAIVAIPLTIIQIQQQQDIRQRASTQQATWATDQSASSSCPDQGGTAIISVSFTNTEPNQSDLAMTVQATDQQTGKSVNLGNVNGGQTKTGQIDTEETDLQAGTVVFSLAWSDGHAGADTRNAAYTTVSDCQVPTPTLTPTGVPSGSPTPTPTICPTLGPIKNVHIECPDCK